MENEILWGPRNQRLHDKAKKSQGKNLVVQIPVEGQEARRFGPTYTVSELARIKRRPDISSHFSPHFAVFEPAQLFEDEADRFYLRCGREYPSCKRCQKTKSECFYPAPPDRKRLAFERAQAKNAEVGNQIGTVNYRICRTHDNPSAPHPSSPSTEGLHAPQRNGLITPEGDHSASIHRAQPEVRLPQQLQQTLQEGSGYVEVSREVALFLIEIYFERHYQADLLFHKRDFIQSYKSGRIADHVSRAIFAFASLFLPSVAGGFISGEIDIGDISRADWRAIGSRWSEQASQQALMNADKPCLELIQACQILALYWFAKAETIRTNMHTAIAYRASRLLHLHQIFGKGSVTDWSADRDRGMRCFWACWLTKCASQANARFQVDCWADVIGCPLPDDGADGSPTVPRHCLDKHGLIQDIRPTQQNPDIGFHSALIIIQGHWWEVQRFAQTVYVNYGSPTERVSEYCSLSKRLEELSDKMAEFTQYEPGHEPSKSSTADQARTFSIIYLYHLCVVYLHSCMVPVLSCRRHPPTISRAMIRLAAEQAWKHSVCMTTIAEQFIARKASVSKSWPIVGYGAYVCAAIQLRRFLALGVLSYQRLQETKVHLHLTGELSKYWMTLRPLHQDMERQFSQAQSLISSRVNDAQEVDQHRHELTRLIYQPDSCSSPELSSHLRMYVANEDIQGQNEQPEQQNFNAPVTVTDARGTSLASNVPLASDHTPLAQTLEPTIASETQQANWELAMDGPRGNVSSQSNWTLREDCIWWNQDPSSLGDVFGSGFFLHNDMVFQEDTY
ncbi:hypothetical protein CNMCM5878_002601 [Aspergillus fumigatiaffinis]|nr:hypothetical protein CNMCM5878_002601 [Aspergillus fumigatiaffinis]